MARPVKSNETDGDEGSLGAYIRTSRLEQKFTVHTLADELNVSPGYISKLENNQIAKPSDEFKLRLIKLLGLDPIRVDQNSSDRTQTIKPETEHSQSLLETDLFPFDQSDFHSELEDVAPYLPLVRAHLELARGYGSLGDALRQRSLPSQALKAYTNAERICTVVLTTTLEEVHRDICELILHGTRYKLSRTHEDLVKEDKVPEPERRLLMLYQALDLASSIPPQYMGDVRFSSEDWFLGAIGLAQVAGIYGDIKRELAQSTKRSSDTTETSSVLHAIASVEEFERLEREARIKAERQYRSAEHSLLDHFELDIIQLLPDRVYHSPEPPVDVRSALNHLIDLSDNKPRRDLPIRLARLQKVAIVKWYRSLNRRFLALISPEYRDTYFDESFYCLNLAISSAVVVADCAARSSLHALHSDTRSLLVRLHLSLAETYMQSNKENKYEEALWNVQIALGHGGTEPLRSARYLLQVKELQRAIASDIVLDGSNGINYTEIHTLIRGGLNERVVDWFNYPLTFGEEKARRRRMTVASLSKARREMQKAQSS